MSQSQPSCLWLMANDARNETIQSQDMVQTYVTLMMSRCSHCRFRGWFDAEDSSPSESQDDEMESFSSLDSEEDVLYCSVCMKCGSDNFAAAASNEGN